MHNVFWHVLTYTAQLREVFRVTQTKAMNLLLLANDSIVKKGEKKIICLLGFVGMQVKNSICIDARATVWINTLCGFLHQVTQRLYK